MQSELVVKDGRVGHLGLAPDELANKVIFVGDPARTDLVAKHFDEILCRVVHREYVTITGTCRGEKISVLGTGMSTDNVEIALAEMYALYAFDLETKERKSSWKETSIIRVGTSGGVQDDIRAGTLAISTYAVGLDSTGLYFENNAIDPTLLEIERLSLQILNDATPGNYRFRGRLPVYAAKPNPTLVDALSREVSKRDLPFVKGIIATTPGFYGPSARNIQGLVNTVDSIKLKLSQLDLDGLKIVNMDMESSLLFHLGEILGFKCATICPIISGPSSSDKLIDYRPAIDAAIEVAIDCLIPT